jgi:hypothetical protein
MDAELVAAVPSVQKHEFTPASLAPIGFVLAWEEDLQVDVRMTLDALVSYLMTHSERIAAVSDGRETEEEQRDYLARGLRGFFPDGAEREVRFGIGVEAFARPSPQLSSGSTDDSDL